MEGGQLPNDPAQLQARIKQLEQEVALRTNQLIASTSRAYSFLDSLSMGFIMCDVKPEVVLANDTVRKTLGVQGELNLAAIDNLLQPSSLQLAQLVKQSLDSGQPLEYDEVNFKNLVLRIFIAAMINEVGQGEQQKLGVVILVEDITEQKVLERSKDEFLSIASHELRTPLTAIRGNSALISQYYAERLPDQDVKQMVSDIHESSIRLIEIVNDFLDASALEQGKMTIKPEPFMVQDVISDVIRELKNLCESKGTKLFGDPTLIGTPSVTADKQRIKQVIYNLVGNAVKFTENGNITIKTRTDENFVYVSVVDTGRGMSPESQHLLFRKFQQAGSSLLTRDTTKGTGLGLYISKLIVERSGGKIGLENSELGQGSTFTFSLPRTKT